MFRKQLFAKRDAAELAALIMTGEVVMLFGFKTVKTVYRWMRPGRLFQSMFR
jgi:hypothetical protein